MFSQAKQSLSAAFMATVRDELEYSDTAVKRRAASIEKRANNSLRAILQETEKRWRAEAETSQPHRSYSMFLNAEA